MRERGEIKKKEKEEWKELDFKRKMYMQIQCGFTLKNLLFFYDGRKAVK